jgi:hypothetical protein
MTFIADPSLLIRFLSLLVRPPSLTVQPSNMVHLPDEIWLKVAEYIDPPAQRCTCECEAGRERNKVVEQNLINLCLVSKQLRAVFQPLLYRSFVKFSRSCAQHRLLTSDSEWLHKYYQQDEKTFRTIRKVTRLEKFLRTLIHRPDLAAMIKQLHVGWFVEDSSLPVHLRKLYDRLPLHDTLASTFVSALRIFPGFERMCIQSRRSWLAALREGEEGAEVALLLILLPNLRFLHIESKTGDLGQYVQELHDILLGPGPTSWTIKSTGGMLVQHPVDVESQIQQPPQMLKALESLSVWSNSAGIRSLQGCTDLFSLPSLSLFEARGLDQFGALQLEPQISFTSLQHLTLTHCKLRGPAIQALLTRCTRLESLVLDSEYAFNPNASPPSLDAGCLTALQSSAGTLERLTLLMPEYEIESVLDVSSFEKLRFLELNQSFFSHSQGQAHLHKSLPTSIQHLIIRKTTIWIKPRLESFFDTFAQHDFPNLTVLELYAEEDKYEELKKELIGFHTRAQQYGIDFEVEEEPAYNHWWYWMSDSDSEGDSDDDADSDSEPDSDSVDFDLDDSDSENSDAHYD